MIKVIILARWESECVLRIAGVCNIISQYHLFSSSVFKSQNKNNDVYLNLLCCDPNMNGLFTVHQIMQMSEGLENQW